MGTGVGKGDGTGVGIGVGRGVVFPAVPDEGVADDGALVGTAEGATVVGTEAVVGRAVGIKVGDGVDDDTDDVTVTLRTLFPLDSATYTLPLLSTEMPMGPYKFAAVA